MVEMAETVCPPALSPTAPFAQAWALAELGVAGGYLRVTGGHQPSLGLELRCHRCHPDFRAFSLPTSKSSHGIFKPHNFLCPERDKTFEVRTQGLL